MRKKRLLKLADMLIADARRKKGVKFNLGVVVEAAHYKNGKIKLDCATEACAMGLAAISGEFKRAGLSYLIGGDHRVNMTVDGAILTYDGAAAVIFDISIMEANFLFSPSEYEDLYETRGADAERIVAKRIRDFVAGKVGPGYV